MVKGKKRQTTFFQMGKVFPQIELFSEIYDADYAAHWFKGRKALAVNRKK
jgi:hypothetical protein